MPLLKQETDLFPNDLFELTQATSEPWWVMYTLSRQEKKLMRQLERLEIPFYGPTIARRYRAANGRLRTSIEPLFSNYVFVCGEERARYSAVCTGSVSRWMPVPNPLDLVADLRQIRELIATERKFIHILLRDGKITDETRRRIERDLDLEEASLSNREYRKIPL